MAILHMKCAICAPHSFCPSLSQYHYQEEPKSKILMKLPPIMSAEEEAANQVGKFLLREEGLMAAAITAEERETRRATATATVVPQRIG